MSWARFWTRNKRRAHKSPPLRVIRAERDRLLRELGQAQQLLTRVRGRLAVAHAALGEAQEEIAALRAQVARLQNATPIRVPAPMDYRWPENVRPLHRSPMASTRG